MHVRALQKSQLVGLVCVWSFSLSPASTSQGQAQVVERRADQAGLGYFCALDLGFMYGFADPL